MPKQTFLNLPAAKREQILDVIIDEFAENDYANVSISRIVARAGIAKGSFYQYFEDKNDLYGYLFDLIAQAKIEMFSLDHPDPQHIGIFAYMRWILENSVQFELQYPRFAKIGYRMLNGGEHENEMFARARTDSQQVYQQIVALGKRQGDIAPDINEELAAYIFGIVMSDLGRFMIDKVVSERGSDWQGKQPFYEMPETKGIFEQTLRILEFGMGINGSTPK
ncbi:MAG: TetR/AcrR family transcriptional regulator [Chloroflexi bacterium]|nr:TetR/AcrR family transcriptional regulator [Chloroflexota bacterium]